MGTERLQGYDVGNITDAIKEGARDAASALIESANTAEQQGKKSLNAVGKEAKKLNNILEDLNETMNILFSSRKGKNKGVFDNTDKKLAQKTIANIKDQTLANQQLAQLQKSISTSKVKYYTDEINALKHVTQEYNKYNDAVKKGLDETTIKDRKNGVLRWGHAYQALLPEGAENQLSSIGNDFVDFWNKIKDEVKSATGGLRAYSTEAFKDTFSLMTQMESNGFDFSLFKPKQLKDINVGNDLLDTTSKSLKKIATVNIEDSTKDIKQFFRTIEKEAKNIDKKLYDGQIVSQKKLISLYQKLAYYRDNGGTDKDTLRILNDLEDKEYTPLTAINYKKLNEYRDLYIPEVEIKKQVELNAEKEKQIQLDKQIQQENANIAKSIDEMIENIKKTPNQIFEDSFQKNILNLENYKNTIEEINKLKLEPQTENTKAKILELIELSKYFLANIDILRSENGGYISVASLKDNYGRFNNGLTQQYNKNYLEELYNVGRSFDGLEYSSIKTEFIGINKEIDKIINKSNELKSNISKDIQESSKYVQRLKNNFIDIVIYQDDIRKESKKRNSNDVFISEYELSIKKIIDKFPELIQLKDKFFTEESAIDFVKSDSWNSFLSTLPSAQKYLNSIGYVFQEVEKSNISVADTVEESAERQQEAVEKIIDADKRQITSKEELYRATLKQKSIAAIETSIANTELAITQNEDKKTDLEWKLPILREELEFKKQVNEELIRSKNESSKVKEEIKQINQARKLEKDVINQILIAEQSRAKLEKDKRKEERLQKQAQIYEQERLSVIEQQRKEQERNLNIQKEQEKLRTKQPNTEKYLSQKGIVGNEEGWSVVQSLGFAQTQQINNAYNAETGVLETNVDKIVTNYEKLKNAIIATDKAVQRLNHDLKLIQEKTPGVDTSYLQKNIASVEAHLYALEKERDSYAKSSDYQETYKQHIEEIQEAHDAFANSLRQKDAISEYTKNQQRLVDIYKELNKLEDERFRLNKGIIEKTTKTEQSDEAKLLRIETRLLELTHEKIAIEKTHSGNVTKEELKFSEKRLSYEQRLNELKKNASEKQQIDNVKEVNKLYDDLNAKLVRRYELEKRLQTLSSKDKLKDEFDLKQINSEINDLLDKRSKLGTYDNQALSEAFDKKELELRKQLLFDIIQAYRDATEELRLLEAQEAAPGSTKSYAGSIKQKQLEIDELKDSAEKAVESMKKLSGSGNATWNDINRAENMYNSGAANANTRAKAEDAEQSNENKKAALDEKEALDLLKKSLNDVTKAYAQFAASSKHGSDSLIFKSNAKALNDAVTKYEEYAALAREIGVSDTKISILENDALSSSSSSVQNEGVTSITKYIEQIEKYEEKLLSSGKASENTIYKLQDLKQAFYDLAKGADVTTGKGLQEFIYALANLGKDLPAKLKLIGKETDLQWINSNIESFDKLIYKSDDVKSKLTELKAKVADYESAKQSGDKELINKAEIDLLKHAPGLIAKIQQLASGKGNLIDESIGKVTNLEDLNRALLEYAKNHGYVKAMGSSLKASNGEVTGTFIDQNGAVIKLTASMDQMRQAMKVVSTTQQGAVGLFGSFKEALKSVGKSLTFYFSGAALIRRFFGEFRKGIDVLKKYDSALTNISYTMDMSKDQLDTLGQSAVDMAKDLSLSLDNTLKIYQIYANMQTTAEEIAETARPTAILSNLSGVDASTASDQIQGILNQFNMLKDADADAAETSMHVVDVLDKISANVAIDYAKGIGIITDAVTATGSAAADAGMSYEQLAAVSAKVAERTREDGSSIGNAIKTILTRISKVGKMPGYADEVDNETLSKASESLNEIGIAVYNADGSFRNISVILGELAEKWDGLTDAQQSNISYNVAATRQSNKFRAILEAWTSATELATDATNSFGNAEANQEKYLESYNGKLQQIKTQLDAFWLALFNSDAVSDVLDFIIELTKGFNNLAEAITPLGALLVGFTGILGGITAGKYIKGKGFLEFIKNFGRAKMFALFKYAEINKCSLGY